MDLIADQQQVHARSQASREPTSLTVLGATGSIGTSTLDLVARHEGRFDVVALTAQSNVTELARLARKHDAAIAVIGDATRYEDLKSALADTDIAVAAGETAILEAAQRPVDTTMAAIVGAAGIAPTFAATRHAKRIALANKECLVTGGDVFMQQVATCGCEVLPVDSEHSGVFQALAANNDADVEQITLTASGGPFRTWSREKMQTATVEEALNHPNWSMGSKITIDSATMMNKGLELIEAFHLFAVKAEQLDCVIHPQSIVHCLVAFQDGATLAQLAMPDMRTPIAYALGWPGRLAAPTERLNLTALSGLTFEAVDEHRFPALRLAREALKAGGAAPAILNAANEVAVAAFLDKRLGFGQIADLVAWTLEEAGQKGLMGPVTSLDEICNVDGEARALSVSRLNHGL